MDRIKLKGIKHVFWDLDHTLWDFDSNAFDEDNDSLVFSWGTPLDHFPAGDFDPPTNPGPVPFVVGFSYDNPTPDESFDPGNIPATMDPNSGEITFKSNTPGNFGFVQKIDCYRDGILIATINPVVLTEARTTFP